MAIDGFLAIPDIQGESLRDGHEGEIEFHGLSFGMATAVSAGETMSRRRGRATLDSVTVVKHYDRASPSLKKMVFDARLAPQATLSLRRTVDGETSDYLVIVLKEASVTSYDLESTEEGLLEEVLTLDYRSIRFTYDGQHEVELDVATGR